MTTWKGIGLVLLASAFLCIGLISAQGPRMVADIPFEFHVGDAVLPPGNYTFLTNVPVLEVAGGREHVFQIYQNSRPKNGDEECVVVFNRYEDGSHFLTEVRIPGQPVRKMTRSRSEKEAITTDWTVQQIALALRPAGSASRN